MSRRTSVLLIGAGAAAVLVALVMLWQSTRSHAVPLPPSTQPAAPPPVASAPEHAPAMPAPAQTAARPAKPSAPAPGRTATPTPTPVPAPAAPTAYDENANLQYGSEQIFALTAEVEPLVRDCVSKAVVAGEKPSGTAWLTYTVVQRGDKFVVEDTGFDPAKTTLKGEGLLECLHQTAKAMKYQGLPRNVPEIWVARSVTLDGGKIVEYRQAWWSSNPPKQ